MRPRQGNDRWPLHPARPPRQAEAAGRGILLLAIFLFLLSVFLFLAKGSHAAPNALTLDALQGETMTYDIKKIAIKAGQASLQFQGTMKIDDQDVILIVFTANALNFYDQEKIYLNKETFFPVMVQRDLNIWGKKEKIIERYDTKTGRLQIVKQAEGKTTKHVIEGKESLDNLYGFIYRYRFQGRFKPGETLVMRLPTQNVSLKVVGDKPLDVGGKIVDCLYMESDPPKYRVWFDKEDKKVPLRIDGAVGFGKTAMIMREYKKGAKSF
ncbi:MAG: DUF3108 domain-containing protein [Candidatus Omnitrophota bacterium]|nr:DUF3108 domain-containing protein [Candidatus Omnitrophota bacterium]